MAEQARTMPAPRPLKDDQRRRRQKVQPALDVARGALERGDGIAFSTN
jgi:hypothetical protein